MNLNKLKIFWNNIEKIGIAFSIIISISAFIISIRSCNDSDEALRLSKEEFQSKRILILQSQMGNVSPGFLIEPINKNLTLRDLKFHFPSNLTNETTTLKFPEFQFYLSDLQDKIIYLLDSSFTSIIKTRFKINDLSVPVIIESEYVAEGSVLKNNSLYNLEFSFTNDAINDMHHLEFRNLLFIEELKSNESNIELNNLWENNFKNISVSK